MKYAVMSKGGELKGTNYAISDQFPAEIMEDAGFFIRSWQRRGKETKGLAFLLINCTSMGSYTGIIASHTGWMGAKRPVFMRITGIPRVALSRLQNRKHRHASPAAENTDAC